MEKIAVYYTFKIDKPNSCADELVKLANYCKENNYECCLYMDIVKSRKITTERNSLIRLKNDIERENFSKIIITSLTNISRDTNFNLKFISLAEEKGCQIISMDKFDPHHYKSFIDNILKKLEEEKESE